MKRIFFLILILLLLLTSCSGKDLAPKPSDSNVPPTSDGKEPAPEQVTPPAPAGPASADAYLGWESEQQGIWPFELILETLQFGGYESAALQAANEQLQRQAECQRLRYEEALAKGEVQCREDRECWAHLWAYPVATERYLSAVTVQRENRYFLTGEVNPWNTVSSLVYDKAEDRLIPLEEALNRANIAWEDLDRAVREYASRQKLGRFDGVSSLAFYMREDGEPVFMIGADVVFYDGAEGWPTFFLWEDGETVWMGEDPLPLELVAAAQDDLACLRHMGQYDGAAIPSEAEAAAILLEIFEVQEYVSSGMSLLADGTTVEIAGETCVCVAVGTNRDDQFVREIIYAVSYGGIYRYDPVGDGWVEVGFG